MWIFRCSTTHTRTIRKIDKTVTHTWNCSLSLKQLRTYFGGNSRFGSWDCSAHNFRFALLLLLWLVTFHYTIIFLIAIFFSTTIILIEILVVLFFAILFILFNQISEQPFRISSHFNTLLEYFLFLLEFLQLIFLFIFFLQTKCGERFILGCSELVYNLPEFSTILKEIVFNRVPKLNCIFYIFITNDFILRTFPSVTYNIFITKLFNSEAKIFLKIRELLLVWIALSILKSSRNFLNCASVRQNLKFNFSHLVFEITQYLADFIFVKSTF